MQGCGASEGKAQFGKSPRRKLPPTLFPNGWILLCAALWVNQVRLLPVAEERMHAELLNAFGPLSDFLS